jgi:hypothetical protein
MTVDCCSVVLVAICGGWVGRCPQASWFSRPIGCATCSPPPTDTRSGGPWSAVHLKWPLAKKLLKLRSLFAARPNEPIRPDHSPRSGSRPLKPAAHRLGGPHASWYSIPYIVETHAAACPWRCLSRPFRYPTTSTSAFESPHNSIETRAFSIEDP